MFIWLANKIGIRTRQQFRLLLRGIAIFFITVSGFAVGLLMELHLFWWSGLPFAVLLLSTIFEFILGDYFAERNYPFETEKKLDLLERRLGARAVESISEKLMRIIQGCKACDTSQISGTVHIIVELTPTPESVYRHGLLQLTDYVGPYGGSKGRITTLEEGVIGRCARTGKTEHVNFADKDEYYRRMVEEFGFSKKEASLHTTIARSFIAEPLILKTETEYKIIGVLYFFTTEMQAFPQAFREINLKEKALDLVDLLKTIALI
jgi:hypothetical protein